MSRILLFTILLLVLGACNQHRPSAVIAQSLPPETVTFQPAKNVILLIGDGMGLTQISAALYSNNNRLNLEEFSIIGFQKSFSSDNLITDSAASATAFSCGVKTYNGAIGVNRDTLPVSSILDESEANGMATGVITTSTIVHATPAAFLAHQPERKMYEEIALDVINSGADLLIGGGKKYFDQRTMDTRNLYQELAEKNYLVSDFFQTDFLELSYSADKNLAYFSANGDPVPFAKGRNYLVPAAKMAPNFLQSRSQKGFFLMIEAAQIDWGGHANDFNYILNEMLEFDQVIGEILQFAKENGETLVIVTGDHETGGLSINLGSKMNDLNPKFTTEYHTGTLIPVFAFGPGEALFSGIYDNTDIFQKMRQALQLDDRNSVLELVPASTGSSQ
ncbi:MAG: alkaline phosphatase [Saprospirales bacterium]|nr:alkaline phosphatase [Saprospirales bacterium]